MAKEPLSTEERQAILENALAPYLRKGWLIQSQSATRAQLYQRRERGCLGKLFFGLWDLIFKRKANIMVVHVDEYGQVHTERTRAHV